MKVSQVLHKMDKDELVRIFDSTKPIDDGFLLYEGTVRGIHRDSPLLPMGVDTLMADEDVIVIDVGIERRREQ